MAAFISNPMPGYKYLANYTLNDIGDTFCYEHDTGDGLDFACKKHKRKVDVDSKKDIIVLQGAGLGIWKNNISSLYALFSGKISPLLDEEDAKKREYISHGILQYISLVILIYY